MRILACLTAARLGAALTLPNPPEAAALADLNEAIKLDPAPERLGAP